MRLACIGWGSLIWAPGELPIDGKWREDGPLLPVEFGRHSSRDRLTLVLCDAAPPTNTLWSLLRVDSLQGAVTALREREGFQSDKWIGRWPSGLPDGPMGMIATWASLRGIDGVVWTAAPPKWADRNYRMPRLDEALAWLGGLGTRDADAREYIERTPPCVRTPYREAFERELGWWPRLIRALFIAEWCYDHARIIGAESDDAAGGSQT